MRSGDIWDVNNPAPKRSTNPDEVGKERAYINSKLPDMRINRTTGEVVRVNAYDFGTSVARKIVFKYNPESGEVEQVN